MVWVISKFSSSLKVMTDSIMGAFWIIIIVVYCKVDSLVLGSSSTI